MILPPSEVFTKKAPTMERDDGDGAKHQRVEDVVHIQAAVGALEHESTQDHGRDDGDRVGLEEVGGHAGAVADVVAHVVGDDRRVAWIVFRNAGLDLTDQVGANVGALGEDAAAQTGEDGDQRAAEGETDQGMQRLFIGAQEGEVTRHAEQTKTDHQHAGDRAAAEGDGERRLKIRPSRPARCGHWREPTRSCRCSRPDPERMAPIAKPPAVAMPSISQRTRKSTAPTMPMVVY